MNTRSNSFVGICEEPNVRVKLQKSEINMADSGAIGSIPKWSRVLGRSDARRDWAV